MGREMFSGAGERKELLFVWWHHLWFQTVLKESVIKNPDVKLLPNILCGRLPSYESNMWEQERPSIKLPVSAKTPDRTTKTLNTQNSLKSEIYLKFYQIIATLCSILPFCFSNILPDYVSCENKYIFLWLLMLRQPPLLLQKFHSKEN